MAKYIVGLLVGFGFIALWYWIGKRNNLNKMTVWVIGGVVGLTLGLGAAAVMLRKEMADRGEVGEYRYDKPYNEKEQLALSKAVDMFNKNICRNMYDMRADVSKLDLSIIAATVEQTKAYGWDKVIHMDLIIVARPRTATLDESMGGKILHYSIGGGTKPGVEMRDMWSAVVCGKPFNPNQGVTWVPLEKADQLFLFLTPGAQVEETLGGGK